MKFAVIDCETTGLFDFSKPADADGQPRMASIAIIPLDDALAAEGEHEYLVAPDGWVMGEEAGAINGLTTDFLAKNGKPVSHAINHYAELVDAGYVVASYGAQFDTKVMRAELRRAGLDDRFEGTPNFCIMRALVGVCRVPKKSGGGYKLPKLGEACAHFKIEQPSAHTAMGDARSAAELLRRIHRLGLLPDFSTAQQHETEKQHEE